MKNFGRVLSYGNRRLRYFDDTSSHIINTIQNTDGVQLTKEERYYVDFIVKGLKGIGAWDKIKALYGFVGGTAATHRWNWKDMRDLNEAFKISWLGGITHNNLGIKGDGISGSGNTHLTPISNLTLNNNHVSLYTNTKKPTKSSIDVFSGSSSDNRINLSINYSGRVEVDFYSDNVSSGGRVTFPTNTVDCSGFYLGSRVSVNMLFGLKNESVMGRNTNNSTTIQLPSISFELLRYYYGHSDNNLAFVTIGDGLTEQQAIQMSAIITHAQGILSRK